MCSLFGELVIQVHLIESFRKEESISRRLFFLCLRTKHAYQMCYTGTRKRKTEDSHVYAIRQNMGFFYSHFVATLGWLLGHFSSSYKK